MSVNVKQLKSDTALRTLLLFLSGQDVVVHIIVFGVSCMYVVGYWDGACTNNGEATGRSLLQYITICALALIGLVVSLIVYVRHIARNSEVDADACAHLCFVCIFLFFIAALFWGMPPNSHAGTVCPPNNFDFFQNVAFAYFVCTVQFFCVGPIMCLVEDV